MSSPCLARLVLALLALPLAACGSSDVDPPRDGGDADGGDTDASVRDGGGSLSSDCVTDVAIGSDFACVLRTDGQVHCWGANDVGQLGDGTTMPRVELAPVLVDGAPLSGAVELGAGFRHACARRMDGTVLCWGDNGSGQLARPSLASAPAPIEDPATGMPVSDAESLAVGVSFTCVARDGGGVFCAGLDNAGQLGQGAPSEGGPGLRQVLLDGTRTSVRGVSDLDVAGFHGCGLQDPGVACWGRGDRGQLGSDAPPRDSRGAVTAALTDLETHPARDVFTGFLHSCALLANGELWCWGEMSDGLGGIGTFFSFDTPTRIEGLPLGRRLVKGSGGGHVCVVTEEAALSCFGRNDGGQLGDGTTQSRVEPGFVLQADGTPLDGVQGVAETQVNTCATLAFGEVYCWGASSLWLEPMAPPRTVPTRIELACP